jgi:hypothetical protein
MERGLGVGAAGGVLRREPINLEWTANVRFGAHNGLKSDMPPCPKSAKSRHGRTVQLQRKSRPEAAPKFIPMISDQASSMQALTFDEIGYSSAKSQ